MSKNCPVTHGLESPNTFQQPGNRIKNAVITLVRMSVHVWGSQVLLELFLSDCNT